MNVMIVFLLAYLCVLFLIAYHFSKKLSLDSFFVNARSTNVWVMTFSFITTIIGTGATIVVISEVAHTGISYGLAFLISATVGMTALGFFAHRIKQYGDIYQAFTIVDFFGKRFDRKNRYITGILQLIVIFLLISIQATAISTLTAIVLDISFAYALAITAFITIAYTTIGGFKIDILTDFLQFWALAFIFVVVAVVSFFQVQA
ncbi:MAG TPA: hypothetical protein VK158_05950, partial [Acidobacteriota bacterium]|nr:hypothetical protein [Acidobacteriota bacterium]